MVPSSQQPPEGGCWAPFSCSRGGLKEAPQTPVRENVIPFNTACHLPLARGGHSCSPPGALKLLAHTSNRSQVAEKKSYGHWKLAERCQLRCCTSTIELLWDAFWLLLNGPLPTYKKFSQKVKTCRCLEGHPCGMKKRTAAVLRQ
jgi:hypothetical protein